MPSPNDQPAWVRRISGVPGVLLAFAWGLAEGTFFFVVPDVAISLAALLDPRRAWRHILAAVAGAVCGGALLYTWAAHDPSAAHKAVAQVPFVTANMMAKARASYAIHPLAAVFLGPLSGIPYKIYAIEAPQFLGRVTFLAATIPARAERFLLVWLFFGCVGTALRRYGRATPSQLTILYGFLWVAFYAFYWGRIALARG